MDDKIKKNIKSMLGAPIHQIDLSDEHYNIAFIDALDSYELYNPKSKPVPKKIWVYKFALANCKEILGRIGKVGDSGYEKTTIDYKSLLSESKKEKNKLIRLFKYY
jgi:hypothetical protein